MLELGCNVGATSIIAAELGAAQVVGVDIDAQAVASARVNAARHGAVAEFVHLPDTRRLPFADATFDLVICNSVLEYVPIDIRCGVLAEVGRVLAPGGVLLVHGTSNRLWPREVHSGQWLGNWIPRALAPRFRRGVNPLTVRRFFGGYQDLLEADPSAFADIKRAQGMSARNIRLLSAAAGALHLSPGMLLPSFMLALRKPGTDAAHASS